MYIKEKFKDEVEALLKKEGINKEEMKIEKPPEGIEADLAFPCFILAKKMKKNPVEIAKELSSKIKPYGLIKEVKATGPYLNFYIDEEKIVKLILDEIEKMKDKYGSYEKKETVLIDTFQPNPFKAFHIGHVRNAVLGESIRKVLEFNGKKVICVAFMGDVGTHVAKWMWYYKKFFKGNLPKENFTKWAAKIYAEANKKVEENEEYKKEVDEINKLIDKRDAKIIKEWKVLKEACLKDFWKIQKELEVRLEGAIMESECEAPGKKMVMNLFKQKKLKESQGAIGIDLSELGFFILLKSDGTALYSTKDFGLFYLKKKKFKFDKLLYVIGSEQDFYLKQLFKALDLLKIYQLEKNIHISYGMVTLKEGKMASRLGNVVLYEDLRDKTIEKIKEEIEKRNPSLENKEKVATIVAFGAIKYTMLDMENNKQIKFDWDAALDFEGRSGPYLQYTHARAKSILRKAKVEDKFDSSILKNDEEIKLIKKLAEFPLITKKACDLHAPNLISNYVYELAQHFNTFYNAIPVLKADEKEKQARLHLVKATVQVIKNALSLLGIEAPEKM